MHNSLYFQSGSVYIKCYIGIGILKNPFPSPYTNFGVFEPQMKKAIFYPLDGYFFFIIENVSFYDYFPTVTLTEYSMFEFEKKA